MKIYIWDAVAGEGKFEIEYEDRYYEWHWKKSENILPAGIFIAKTRETRQKIGSLRYDTFSMNRFRDMSTALRI